MTTLVFWPTISHAKLMFELGVEEYGLASLLTRIDDQQATIPLEASPSL